MQGGLIWNRPASVLTVDADGRERLLPVQDITRQTLWVCTTLQFSEDLPSAGEVDFVRGYFYD
jgi:hypothetical protein